MCQSSHIHPIVTQSLFEPSADISSPLNPFFCNEVNEDFLHSPFFAPLHATIFTCDVPSSDHQIDKYPSEAIAQTFLVQKNGVQNLPSPKRADEKKKVQNGKEAPSESSLQFHKDYLKKRLEETWPQYVSSRKLFEEIKAKGYRGAFKTLQAFLTMMRKQNGIPSKSFLEFHKDYLKKRLEETWPHYVSSGELFREIKAKGYRGALKTLQSFLTTMRNQTSPEKTPLPEAYLQFHKNYLVKRLTDSPTEYRVSTRELFKELRDRGYQGGMSTMQAFAATIRSSTPEASLKFHKSYLVERLANPDYKDVSTRELFKELQDRGYQGACKSLANFLIKIRKSSPPQTTSLKFHRDYLIKRLEEHRLYDISAAQLFREIKNRGYLGTFVNVSKFVSSVRRAKLPPHPFLNFHKSYLIERIQSSGKDHLTTTQLFQEIRHRGYLGTLKNVQRFVAKVKGQGPSPEDSLDHHEDYLVKRLREGRPNGVSSVQLFREISDKGYRGTIRSLQYFLTGLRREVAR